ncbi:YeiH family protein [Pseudoalteromonas denitrificans]|uniref:Conserved hypothetical integral membrane protein n=1 Tax=Pseudoalteromonas denitrificans DSM 6059 TaxID=1123010 RepID=A0A1I1G0X2_9GAMM|nr:putative sulfate exporter family transporter [Pseudoalteromonas denitrificans]SFC05151.1 conserved hypothetical integral membrane protein [Pseudoalteromonas denitrificans DSM 6059]
MTLSVYHHYKKVLYILLFLLTALPFIGATSALILGTIFSFIFNNPFEKGSATLSKWLLKAAVIGLGFSVDINQVIEIGKNSLLLTALSISLILLIGQAFGKWLKIKNNISILISFGTAICGGSAIAAMAPVIKAKDDEIAISLAVVFFLNALSLLIFPYIGKFFNLTDYQFGMWAALAIHDTSSVVAASTMFGGAAVTIATTVKLTRAMWIIPYTVLAGSFSKSEEKATIPLFIIGFILAAMINTYFPQWDNVWSNINGASKQILVMCLFLIGSGLSKNIIKQVGIKPLLMAVILWVAVSIIILLLIMKNLI